MSSESKPTKIKVSLREEKPINKNIGKPKVSLKEEKPINKNIGKPKVSLRKNRTNETSEVIPNEKKINSNSDNYYFPPVGYINYVGEQEEEVRFFNNFSVPKDVRIGRHLQVGCVANVGTMVNTPIIHAQHVFQRYPLTYLNKNNDGFVFSRESNNNYCLAVDDINDIEGGHFGYTIY